jgi:Sec-independent protein translocase protein TatA
MDVLGIGPLELLFIFLIALIFLGPTDMVKAGRTLGKAMRKIVTSDAWREITRLRTLPNQLMREAGLEEQLQELKDIQKDLPKAVDFKDADPLPELKQEMNSIQPDLSAWTSPEQPLTPLPDQPEPVQQADDSGDGKQSEEKESSSSDKPEEPS